MLSADPAVNPDFSSFNAVFLHYCDGASFGGGRVAPVPVHTRGGQPALMWLRGRANFDAIVAQLRAQEGLDRATEVVLSGGSAGGLAVFYNLDHLATLLPASTRLVGFPDAGFFLDAPDVDGNYSYRAQFQGADPVWNVTGSGGTNAACLAYYGPRGEPWKCLLAPYLTPFVRTPLFIMNSAYDAWQTVNILKTSCVPTPSKPCNASALEAYGRLFKATLASALAASHSGSVAAYADSCYVHEQNVNYCSTQSIPNCVGWSPKSSGSKKWGYTTQVDKRTPQQAFGDWYFARGSGANVTIDAAGLQMNPSCLYQGHPVSL